MGAACWVGGVRSKIRSFAKELSYLPAQSVGCLRPTTPRSARYNTRSTTCPRHPRRKGVTPATRPPRPRRRAFRQCRGCQSRRLSQPRAARRSTRPSRAPSRQMCQSGRGWSGGRGRRDGSGRRRRASSGRRSRWLRARATSGQMDLVSLKGLPVGRSMKQS
jgi:hypothetical protein